MKSNRRLGFVPLLIVICGLSALQSNAQNAEPSARKQLGNNAGSVSGRTTVRGAGTPGIAVKLHRLNPSTPKLDLSITSGEDGVYRIENVPPATYQIQLASEDFYPENRFDLKILVVAAGEHLVDVDYAMLPGGVVTGTVRDPKGKPIAGRLVTLMTPKPPPAKDGALMPAGNSTSTGDDGVFRIRGAAAGRYFVAVKSVFANSSEASQALCLEAIYPAANNPAKAVPINLAEGQRIDGIDIAVGSDGCFSASGQVIDSGVGAPAPGVWLRVTTVDGERISEQVVLAKTNDDGVFTIGGMLPGQYRVSLEPKESDSAYSEPVDFDIADRNIVGLLIDRLPGASVSGSIVVEGAQDETVGTSLSGLMVGASVKTPKPGIPAGNVFPINPDGTFKILGLPTGNLNLQLVSRTSTTRKFVLLRTELNGVRQPKMIPIKSGEHITDLKLVVAYGTGSIRGAVKYEKGTVQDQSVNIALYSPDDHHVIMWSPIDVRGNFLLEGIPAGSYWIGASAYSTKVKHMISVRRQITVGYGVASEITLQLDLNAGSDSEPLQRNRDIP